MDDAFPERRNLYGRIRGKTLRASQKTYLAEDLGPLTLHGVTSGDNPAREPVDLRRFGGGPIWLRSALAAANIWWRWRHPTPASG